MVFTVSVNVYRLHEFELSSLCLWLGFLHKRFKDERLLHRRVEHILLHIYSFLFNSKTIDSMIHRWWVTSNEVYRFQDRHSAKNMKRIIARRKHLINGLKSSSYGNSMLDWCNSMRDWWVVWWQLYAWLVSSFGGNSMRDWWVVLVATMLVCWRLIVQSDSCISCGQVERSKRYIIE